MRRKKIELLHKWETTAIGKGFMQNHKKKQKIFFCTPVTKFLKISTLIICNEAKQIYPKKQKKSFLEKILYEFQKPGPDPALVIRGRPNSEHFLSILRKLIKRSKFFLTTQSLIVKRN